MRAVQKKNYQLLGRRKPIRRAKSRRVLGFRGVDVVAADRRVTKEDENESQIQDAKKVCRMQ